MPTKTARAPRTRRAPKSAARRRRITPEDLRKLTSLADPRISPDGATIVFVHKVVGEKNEYQTSLWTAPVAGGAPRRFTAGPRDRSPRWSPDGSRLAFVRESEKGRPQIYLIEATGGEAVALTSLPEGSIGALQWSPDGRRLAVSFREQDPDWTTAASKERKERGLSDPPRVLDHWWYRLDGDGYFNGQRYHLHTVDVDDGATHRIYAKDTLGFFEFDFSPDGKQVVVASNRDRRAGLRAWNDDLLVITLATGRMTPIPDLPRGPKTRPRWSPDGRSIAYAGREGADSTYSTENLELWVCDARRGRARSLTADTDVCLMAPPVSDSAEIAFEPNFCWSRDGRRLLIQVGWRGESHLAAVPAGGGPLVHLTSGAKVCSLGNLSEDGRSMAMLVASPTRPDEVHVAQLQARSARLSRLSRFNDALLSELQLSTPTTHWIKTPDGTRVHTWMMRPVGFKTGRRHPAVLEIHGGPHAQYGVGFFHEFQVLAAAGYVVVFSNPRGSKGYGRDHCAAIRGRWGSADWTDIQAVTSFMQDRPEIDPRRMGIMGGSYGGYMANWAIGHTDAFAGAITDRCVSNLVSLFGSSDFVEPPDLYWEGNAWDRPEPRWDQSPLKYLGKARTPTLVIHSEGDLRCNIEQAEQVFAALSVRKVPARLVRYPRNTSHGMSRCGPPDMRVHRLHQILDWWEEYL